MVNGGNSVDSMLLPVTLNTSSSSLIAMLTETNTFYSNYNSRISLATDDLIVSFLFISNLSLRIVSRMKSTLPIHYGPIISTVETFSVIVFVLQSMDFGLVLVIFISHLEKKDSIQVS